MSEHNKELSSTKWRKAVFHPFLIALIPILHILANNPGQASFSDALMPMLISLGFTLVAFVVLLMILKNSEAAGLIVSLFLVLFFSLGHLVDFTPGVRILDLLFFAFCAALVPGVFLLVKLRSHLRNSSYTRSVIAVALIILAYAGGLVLIIVLGRVIISSINAGWYKHLLFSVFCVIFVVGVLLVVKFRSRLQNLTSIVNVVAAALMVLILFNLFTSVQRNGAPTRANEVRKAAESQGVACPDPTELPDIYYFVFDSYGSERFIRDMYGYDNSEFVRWLETRGFYVAHDSHSNYNRTYLSLASSLNQTYINYLSDEFGEESRDFTPLWHLIEDNSLVYFLKSRGYKFIFFGSGWKGTQANRHADIAHVVSWTGSEFTTSLINSTALRYFISNPLGEPLLRYATRESVLNTFADIPQAREKVDGPLFLFAHIMPPHAPFLFSRDGAPMKPDLNKEEMYIEQLMFVNKKIKEMVDGILSVSDRPPVIVIQADHDPAYGTEIMNAYLVPVGEDLLYRSITPVNSFRVILNGLFGTDFKILEDRVYTTTSILCPYTFVEITETP